ncbi:Zn-dependent protease [Cryptosporidium sp. chipmunk genotype I]|uniref:Zn-dependent protease n=1 Tax=Cryptosporidium sp. chipmunk genotype I TaxID=1280935 RepID=UPI00351A59A5|nr:Zn-dependent protease [Cryptosporidium sp. chipmunk genotype I]
MIFLSLIGAFEPIISLNNLKFIVKNLEILTGKEIKFIKHAEADINLVMKGRSNNSNVSNLKEYVSLREQSNIGEHHQISTNSMLEVLLKMKNKFITESSKNKIYSNFFLIGITSLDIFPTNDHEYVFGQSDPEKGIAIISAYRLYQNNENLMNSRILKVIMHEYGHLMNLGHCKHRTRQ